MRFFFRYLLLWLPLPCFAQGTASPMETISLNDLSAFRPAKANWQIAGNATADLNKDETLSAGPGTGVLVNLPDAQNRDNLFFGFEHGDLDLELDVMMARHSNSGIYLQGRYELQLLDSWGVQHPGFGDIAGVYERWNDNKPEGQKGFQGVPPRINAARAPGLWQHLRIEFQAPRFDASGRKTSNARLIRVVLNGITVQENIELTGPTRGPAFPGEAPLGPIMIQGDHGPVAFRNIRYQQYGGQPARLDQLKYRYFAGEHDYLPDFTKLKADASGDAEGLTWEYAKGDNDFALQFTGTLTVPENGAYAFTLQSNANSMLKINGDTVIGQGWWTRTATLPLPAGAVPIEITYCKAVEWLEPALGLAVAGPHTRSTPLHLPSSYTMANPVNPILIQPGNEPELLRSFIDIPQAGEKKTKRIVHAISVGYPNGPSYSYDLDNGALVQVWKGGFLDATPMWHDRGDGHAKPLGSVVLLGDTPQLGAGSWPDTIPASANYRLGGYQLDAGGNPVFQYSLLGVDVTDRLVPQENGKWLLRELNFSGHTASELQFRVATGKDIVRISDDLWAVDDKRYYIQFHRGHKPEIRPIPGGQEMVVPTNGPLQYYLIW